MEMGATLHEEIDYIQFVDNLFILYLWKIIEIVFPGYILQF